ncbi:AraC family transcriptional regulator [Sphingobacterium kitahiroshimense]|uniref:AraC family transcriptional regulator n=1 Tax=Sphingobacterium kitahiroshimense TaxID=470446 RepID=UPI00320BA171
MKKALQIDLKHLFGAECLQKQITINPSIKMAHGSVSYYGNQGNEAILQEFDGLLGYVNMVDFKSSQNLNIPIHIETSDLHIFYLMEAQASIEIENLQQHISYRIDPARARYFYLPPGSYQLQIPRGRCSIFNFYFRCSIFRNGNERPFQFLHPLITAHRQSSISSCCSIDFRIGPRTRARIQHLLTKLTKGDLDNEEHVFHELKELIKLSKEKIFEEYEKLSDAMIKAKQAHDLIVQYVDLHGQNFHIKTIYENMGISHDYLNEIFHRYYNQSPSQFKYMLMEAKIKKLLLTDSSIANIAYSCGYSEVSALTKFFKKRTDLTPTEYQATKKENPDDS